MRAIIIAAGMGSRLEHHTVARPKCMVEVDGRSIMDHQRRALGAAGVDELHIVRGYLSERLVVPGATYWENPAFRENNILHSLFAAEPAFEGPLLTSYSDILYTPEVARRAASAPHDVSLIVDRRWADAYVGRIDHPIGQAELCECRGERIDRVGKWVGAPRAAGEFIGLAKFSARGARVARAIWRDLRARLGDDDRFQHARLFRKAYLTDLFMEMIERGHPVHASWIEGGWREIDTVEDLRRAHEL